MILNLLSCPIIIIDRNYTIVAANKSACRLYCFSLDNIVGHKCFRITHSLDSPCWQEEGLRCPVKTAFALKRQTKVIHKHHNVFEEITPTPIFDDQGKAEFVIEELNDITEL